ncbi:MAG TPA: thioredoxin-dependent thiol peroxidase [Acidobacteriota bacterium]|nr:thioredoxin-dependent thiol peroxidase [Acidobacteriota bacterium]HMZ78150.1 thioredoxin-dependent thiol peroxidase [Acidobacteriota bacterium]HNB69563.1 thioredoxin-dependent thiol peroxidase [Acidobacteriota bacterium]HNC44829.1 thioredoxin-dependent thiol peroxidase [Acidobacteriota bacterium]HND19427.1 thioredoxin-dependent thiol peroxidase [Acidobacteriota bacterium]
MSSETPRELKVGDPAPAFSLQTGDGTTVNLSDFKGQRVVLYFYPRDNTPGCTREACGFRDDLAKLNSLRAQVLGVSTDSVASHKKFTEQYQLNFPLLSDPEMTVSQAYGVWQEKSNYGKKYFGIVRTTFIIDEEGTISRIFRRVKVDGHTEKVLEALAAK